jgi:hypothetical protein
MEPRRIWLVYVLMAALVGGSLYDLVRDTEHWPFSQYPMYAQVVYKRELERIWLFGVTDEQRPREIPLLAYPYIQPLNQARLLKGLEKMSYRPDGQRLLTEASRDCLVRYEALRRRGRHQGPALQGIRCYRLYWKLDPWARNVGSPDRKQLLTEVRLGHVTGALPW